MSRQVKVTQLSAEGVTHAFIAKGDVTPDAMKKACQEQFIPSQYEDAAIDLSGAKINKGQYRWVPARDEYGEFCGSRLVPTEKVGKGSFFGTELIVN